MAYIQSGGTPLTPGNKIGDIPTWDGIQWQPAQPAIPAAVPPAPGTVINTSSIVYVDGGAVPSSLLIPLTAGCLGRWESDFGIGVADGAPVPTWIPADGAFNLTDDGVAAHRPTFRRQDVQGAAGDNIPFVEFDGVLNTLDSGNAAFAAYVGGVTGPLTVYMVVRTYGLGVANPKLLALSRAGVVAGVGAGTLALRFLNASAGPDLSIGGAVTGDGSSQGGIGKCIGTWTTFAVRMAAIGGQQRTSYWRAAQSGWGFDWGAVGGGGWPGWNFNRIGVAGNSDIGFWNDFARCDVRHLSVYLGSHRDDQVRYMGLYLSRYGQPPLS